MSRKFWAARALLRAVAIGCSDFVRQRGGQFSHHAHAVHVGEIQLHLLQPRQRLCAILDVRQRERTSGQCGQRHPRIGTPRLSNQRYSPSKRRKRCFEMIRNPGGDRFCEHFNDMGKIVGMYRSVCSPVPQLLQRLSAILEDLAIDGFDLTIRGQNRNETRYPVNGRAQTSLAFTQRLLCPLALGQIEHERKALVVSFFDSSRRLQARERGCRLSENTLSRRAERFRSSSVLPRYVCRRSRHSGGVNSVKRMLARNEVITVISHAYEETRHWLQEPGDRDRQPRFR